VRTFAAHPGEIVLIAVGPLSNLAAAVTLDPAFPGNVAELIIMGGAINKSNITPSAEFNIEADPEASAVVLEAAFPKITLVPLDATHQALISLEQCAALRALGSNAGEAAAKLVEFRISGYKANQCPANRARPRRPRHRRPRRPPGDWREIP
jgi:inosine-uridine nucleoside N-ribohydrolase